MCRPSSGGSGERNVDAVVTRLELSASLWRALVEEARRHLPQECCGLLGGCGARVTHVFPATNALASASAYEIPARELFEIFRRLRAEMLELLGIYHSHPTGDNAPSARDREQAYYPGVPYVIVSPRPEASRPVRAFLLGREREEELWVEIEP
ncbi:MAG: M67 family metallopeptidase [Acidobacteria bacterium]|nr:M67 family metallopeptidase [Acidobacteriota bacterium]